MNERERFKATAKFQPVDRAFLLPPWVWASTLERWEREGFPRRADQTQYFQTDRVLGFPLAMQGPYGPHLYPPLEREVLSQTEEYSIVRDEEGNVVKLLADRPTESMPQWIEYPIKTRDDWEQIVKPRLDASVPGRCAPQDKVDDLLRDAREYQLPLSVWTGSFYGWPRSLLGVELLSVMFYDDPGWVHEMCEHIADFVIECLSPVLRTVTIDHAFVWEDMAGKAGPLCSPETYREFMLPPLKRVTELLHRSGVHTIIVDSDGNNDPLIPLWLEAGVTGLRPFEIAAGSDPVATRKRYGKDLIIQGGIDKRALAGTRNDIDREVLSKVPWLCLQGGYFPQVDHLVPHDVSLENYRYYSQLLRKVVEDPERYLNEARRRGYWDKGGTAHGK